MPAIASVRAFPLRLPRDLAQSTGTAGSPARPGQRAGAYYWSSTFPTLYSPNLESTLVRVELDNGMVGWGEAQAPLAPRASAVLVEDLLAPVLEGQPFAGTPAEIEVLWQRMFQTMRVRGQTGGFLLDAISGVDIALWDLAGKLANAPVAILLREHMAGRGLAASANSLSSPWQRVPAYLSGLSGVDLDSRLEFARYYAEEGINLVKLFYESTPEQLLRTIDALGELPLRVAVDALWRLDWPEQQPLIGQLAARRLHWLEAPFYPDEPEAHVALHAACPDLPLALGESYRTVREMAWFISPALVRFVQPDLGRSGITESCRIAQAMVAASRPDSGTDLQLVPHVSIAFGPQIAAAVHLSAALACSRLCEFNPTVFSVSNRFLEQPLAFDGGHYVVPEAPGLGIAVKLEELLSQSLLPQ